MPRGPLGVLRRPRLSDVQTLGEHVGLDRAVIAASQRWPTRSRPFADPPPGSGLRPVMGDNGMPVFGHMLEVILDVLGTSRTRYERYGPVSWAGSAIGPVVSVAGPDGLEEVLRNARKDFANGPAWEQLIGPFFDRGLMLLDFEEHLGHRRIMQAAFTRARLEAYLDTMQPGIAASVERWDTGRSFRALPAVKHLLLESASDVFLGGHPDGETEAAVLRAFTDTVQAGSAFLRRDVVPGSRWARGLRGRELLEQFFRDQLPAKHAQTDHDDLFAALVHLSDDDGNRFTDDDVVNHMIFLLMAAHDTSTITLNTMLWGMARHPQWQERARAEADAIGDRPLRWDDLAAMPTLDLVQREALRYIAPVLVLMRTAVRDTQVLGHHVPAGTTLMLMPLATQRMPEVWDDPDVFDPSRFAPGGEAERVHPYAWAPFGGGVHKCIGLHFAGVQIKTVLHNVLRRYRWSVPDGYELTLDTTGLPVPRDGLPLRLERRTDGAG